jgi:hypothetical protein
MRGYTDVAFILVDEGDFFIPSQQEECRMVVEGYRLKTRPTCQSKRQLSLFCQIF